MSVMNRIAFEANAIGGTFLLDGEPVSAFSALDGNTGEQAPFYYEDGFESREVWLGYEVVSYLDGCIYYAQSKGQAHDLALAVASKVLLFRIA